MMCVSILLATLVSVNDGARILAIVPTPSYSHQIVFQPIFKELANRGHEVVFMTTDIIKDAPPTLKQIDLSKSYEIWTRDLADILKEHPNPFMSLIKMLETLEDISTYQLAHPEVQAMVMNETEHFDLVMTEFTPAAGIIAFKERFKCPLVLMCSMEVPSSIQKFFGNPTHYVLYPDVLVPYEKDLTFFERLQSIFISVLVFKYIELFLHPKQHEKVEKYIGKGYPSLNEILESSDLLLTNTNIALNIVRPYTPATVRIGGGMHIKPEKPLPKDLKEYLDGAKDGFIYLSLGSNVKSKNLPSETMNKFIKVFSEIPYKVLWKFEAENLPGNPDNVKIMNWIPQQDVLRHPNIKAFITQGGFQSLEEALFSHVPMICLPFMGDQQGNAKKITARGIGLSLDHQTMSAEDLKQSLLEIINDPKYKTRVKELATIARDEPMSSLEKAVWWTEYVIRHKGSQHLKGPGLHFPLYQYYYLDVIGFLVVVLSIILLVIYFVLKNIILLLCKLVFTKKVKSE